MSSRPKSLHLKSLLLASDAAGSRITKSIFQEPDYVTGTHRCLFTSLKCAGDEYVSFFYTRLPYRVHRSHNTGDKGTNTQWVHAEHIEITVNK